MKMPAVIALLAVLLLAEGCDFLRALAGRPTSDELAALQEAFPSDTLQQEPADSEAVLPDVLPEELIYRSEDVSYLVVAGCYREPRHAERSAERYRRMGYETCIVDWNGVRAVGLCPTGDRTEARSSLRQLVSKGVCPKGAWIMEKR